MNKENLNFIFWGTPDVASETLEILKQSGFLPNVIITTPDAKVGRGLKIQSSPVALFAQNNKIPCLKPEILDEELSLQLSTLNFELSVVVAYGKIIPDEIINMPKLGSINIHYSLLPKYRGASPVESAILNGDKVTGVTIQKMIYKLDAGPILAKEEIEIGKDEKAGELRARLIKIGAELLIKILPDFIEGKIKETPQNESKVTHCKKIKKENGMIGLNDAGEKNYNKFRAYATWPRTYFFKDGKSGKRTIITEAKLEDGKFIIKKVIPEGGKETDYKTSI